MQTDLNDEIVSLTGAPADVGRVFGEVSGGAIRRDVASFLAVAADADLAPNELDQRLDRYQAIVTRVAPHWLEEIGAIALAAGVPEADYMAHVAQKYVIKGPPAVQPPHECTSFLSIGAASADGRSMLHKNRDSVVRAQGLWIREVAGTNRFLGGGDASDHGDAYFINEHGLAGAMNAGSPNDDRVNEGLPTPQILRLIAERAKTCEDALAILEEVVGEGWYTNGGNGSLWFFVQHGRGLLVENTRGVLDHTWIEDDVDARANDFLLPATFPFARPDALTNTRYLAARQGIERRRGELSVPDVHRLSRDTSSEPRHICGDTTVSAFTAIPHPDRPDVLSMAWVALGFPDNALYVPLFVGAEGVPAFVMDGTLWELSARLRAARVRGSRAALDIDTYEERIAAEVDALQRDATGMLRTAGPAVAARARLTEKSAEWAVAAAAQLALAGGADLQATGAADQVPLQ